MDRRLIDLVENWDELGWFDRKRIWLKCYLAKHRPDPRFVISLATIISIILLLINEQPSEHRTGLLMTTGLFYFYGIMIDFYYRHVLK